MSTKPQVIFVPGGDAFTDITALYAMLRARSFNPYETKQKWQEWLFVTVAGTHECHRLEMPNKYWADYGAWQIWFEKMVPYLRDGVVLVGHSLGGGFLLRYLSEQVLPVTVAQCHLVAPVVTDMVPSIGGFHIDVSTWTGFATIPAAVHLWHSTDDTIVPIQESETLTTLYPAAILHRYTDRFHFIGESFPELAAVIQETAAR